MDQDRDPAETREWLDALDSVEAFEGIGRVDELLDGQVRELERHRRERDEAVRILCAEPGERLVLDLDHLLDDVALRPVPRLASLDTDPRRAAVWEKVGSGVADGLAMAPVRSQPTSNAEIGDVPFWRS